MIKEVKEFTDGEFVWKSDYNEKGNLVKRCQYTIEGSLLWEDKFELDIKGNLCGIKKYNSTGELCYKWTRVGKEELTS